MSVYDSSGKLLRQESILDYTKENIREEYISLEHFIRRWTAEEKKTKIRDLLREHGIDLEQMKAEQGMADVDDFDFICHVVFDKKPLTRREKTEVLKLDPFAKLGKPSRIAGYFGGRDAYLQAVKELEDALYTEDEAG